jgi:hypothetical protein
MWFRVSNRLHPMATVSGRVRVDHVAEVASHPPEKIIVLTDPHDQRVSASVQTAYVEALRRVGVAVDHRFLPASGMLRITCNCRQFWQPSPGWRTIAKRNRQRQARDRFLPHWLPPAERPAVSPPSILLHRPNSVRR